MQKGDEGLDLLRHQPRRGIDRVNLLLGQAIMLATDDYDDVTADLHEAMGIALLMAAQHPTGEPVDLPRLNQPSVLGCVEAVARIARGSAAAELEWVLEPFGLAILVGPERVVLAVGAPAEGPAGTARFRLNVARLAAARDLCSERGRDKGATP